ncbi:MAG: UDP-N-acetylglucosamine--N-acetylmuramyl-(pentapeptide) pyrophosphoryl-undecaprenol N-acetylglucosamine transferase [Chlamydiae bacterium]|nr:UDP-N-acetylglucosamine--N-acetylmuramyl-(pentapeptide) pyrophosphoryl-undecaprenol N-acetylglucosamine transferase [Chlamydiota bacterium]
MVKENKVFIAVGGTGGHIHPALRLADEIKTTPFFIGYKITQNTHLSKDVKKLDVHSSTHNIFKLMLGFFQSLYFLLKIRPSVVFGFGSYHTLPILIASVLFRKKIILFESNLQPGLINRFFSRFAKKTALFFDQVPLFNTTLIEPLLKKNYLEKVSKEEALKYFHLEKDKKTLLIFGGSIGAKPLNKALKLLLSKTLDPKKWQIVHFTGAHTDPKEVQMHYQKFSNCVKTFETKMHLAYTLCDCVIARSGAMTLSELIFFETPALLIPYPFARKQHQHKNARFFQDVVQGGLLLDQQDLYSHFSNTLDRFFSNLVDYKAKICEYKKRVKYTKIQQFLHEIED